MVLFTVVFVLDFALRSLQTGQGAEWRRMGEMSQEPHVVCQASIFFLNIFTFFNLNIVLQQPAMKSFPG